jgi:hypothetical protein
MQDSNGKSRNNPLSSAASEGGSLDPGNEERIPRSGERIPWISFDAVE